MSDKKVKDPEFNRRDKKHKEEDKQDALAIEAAANLAGWKKALADYQNLQKEMNKRLADMNEFVASGMILELLPIFDNYQIAIDHIPENQRQESWAIGLEHILKMWESWLSEHSVEKIKALGQQFDPNLHESVGQVNQDDQDDQIVVEEKLAGYKIKDKVIRPAKVIINNKN